MVRTPPVPGSLALPLAVGAAILVVAGGAAAERPRGRVELEVAGVLPLPEGTSSILVLREKGAKVILPVIVPGTPGRELQRQLEGKAPRGVLATAIEALGARVREIEIENAEEVARGARIHLAQGSRELTLDARPSESVALAVSSGAPIVTTRRLLDQEGLTPADLERAHQRLGGDPKDGLSL